MNHEPRIRRSAGMLKNPREAAQPRLPAAKPPPPHAETKEPEPVCASPRRTRYAPKPKVLMGEVAAPRGAEIGKQREAFRAFMMARHLRPSEWARSADVPPGEILGFLTAKTRSIAPQTLARLAQAAKCNVEDFFR
jgi:hypothetical protein